MYLINSALEGGGGLITTYGQIHVVDCVFTQHVNIHTLNCANLKHMYWMVGVQVSNAKEDIVHVVLTAVQKHLSLH